MVSLPMNPKTGVENRKLKTSKLSWLSLSLSDGETVAASLVVTLLQI